MGQPGPSRRGGRGGPRDLAALRDGLASGRSLATRAHGALENGTMCLLLVTGTFTLLSAWAARLTPAFLLERL